MYNLLCEFVNFEFTKYVNLVMTVERKFRNHIIFHFIDVF